MNDLAFFIKIFLYLSGLICKTRIKTNMNIFKLPKDIASSAVQFFPCSRPKRLFLNPITAGLSMALAISLVSTSCTPRTSSDRAEKNSIDTTGVEEINGESETISSLKIAAIPWQNSAEQEAKIQKLANYLQEKLGVPVTIELTGNYEDTIDLLVEEQVDMAYMGAFSYLKARKRNSALEPLVVPIEKITGRPWYTSVLVTAADSGIDKIEDIKGRQFSFVSPSSTSGFLVPSVKFQELGIEPERDFARVEYSGSHNNSAELLANGEVEVIATEIQAYTRESESGVFASGEYKIIWESDPIPNGPIVISSKLPEPFRVNLRNILIDAPEGLVDVSGADSAGYTIALDADYESIRQIQARLNF
ncbi:MAG: phosphate/phosphite/phosphonate ABC transporter substrate-binding protein [Cyanobacteria bacterium SID2]|nr:phosphate/phosphite/phosphonate ABC transporter substrate-binding protein [Cyanobacteria bacterium SID2]